MMNDVTALLKKEILEGKTHWKKEKQWMELSLIYRYQGRNGE